MFGYELNRIYDRDEISESYFPNESQTYFTKKKQICRFYGMIFRHLLMSLLLTFSGSTVMCLCVCRSICYDRDPYRTTEPIQVPFGIILGWA